MSWKSRCRATSVDEILIQLEVPIPSFSPTLIACISKLKSISVDYENERLKAAQK